MNKYVYGCIRGLKLQKKYLCQEKNEAEKYI